MAKVDIDVFGDFEPDDLIFNNKKEQYDFAEALLEGIGVKISSSHTTKTLKEEMIHDRFNELWNTDLEDLEKRLR